MSLRAFRGTALPACPAPSPVPVASWSKQRGAEARDVLGSRRCDDACRWRVSRRPLSALVGSSSRLDFGVMRPRPTKGYPQSESMTAPRSTVYGLILGVTGVGCYEPAVEGPGTTWVADSASSEAANEGDGGSAADSSSATADAPDASSSCKCGDPGCCPGVPVEECCTGATCPVEHNTGFGDTYWFCGPRGTPGDPKTYTKAMAVKAAKTRHPGAATTDYGCGAASPIISTFSRFTSGAMTVYEIWVFDGASAGRANGPGTSLACPTAAGSTCKSGDYGCWD